MMDIEAMKALADFLEDVIDGVDSCLVRVTFYSKDGFMSAGYIHTLLALSMIKKARPDWGPVSQIEVRYWLKNDLETSKEIYLNAGMIKCDGLRYELN